MTVKSVYGEYTDRIPTEVYEPHDSITFDVHVGVVISMGFDGEVTDEEWDEALEQNVAEALRDKNRWDIIEQSVLYVETFDDPPVARCGRSELHGAHGDGPRWCAGNRDVVQSHETPVQEKEQL